MDEFERKVRDYMERLDKEKAQLEAELVRLDGRITGMKKALEIYLNQQSTSHSLSSMTA